MAVSVATDMRYVADHIAVKLIVGIVDVAKVRRELAMFQSLQFTELTRKGAA